MCELIIFFFLFSFCLHTIQQFFRFAIYICHAIIFFCVRTCVIFFHFFFHAHTQTHTYTHIFFAHNILFIFLFRSFIFFFFFYFTFFVSLFFLSSHIFSLLPYMVIIKCKYDVTFIVIFATHLSSRFLVL